MAMNGHLAAARACLADLRQGSAGTRCLVEQMRQHVVAGGIGLHELGTSTDEICALEKEGAKLRALTFVRELREEGWDRADFISLIRESVIEADCSLADIGTSEQELASFESTVPSLFD